MTNKPNGQNRAPDPLARVPATFCNAFHISIDEDGFTRLVYLEAINGELQIRGAIVAPTPKLEEFAALVLNAVAKVKARAKIVLPQGANTP